MRHGGAVHQDRNGPHLFIMRLELFKEGHDEAMYKNSCKS